jgi:hypothetical protein
MDCWEFLAHHNLNNNISEFIKWHPSRTPKHITEEGKNKMNISDWLDEKEAENVDVSEIVLPKNMAYDEDPDETIYFKEINPCGLFCTENHPFSTVERFGHWYYSRGQDKKAGIHSSDMKWRLFTKNKNIALQTAKERIE